VLERVGLTVVFYKVFKLVHFGVQIIEQMVHDDSKFLFTFFTLLLNLKHAHYPKDTLRL
jgi:hypothetical protein